MAEERGVGVNEAYESIIANMSGQHLGRNRKIILLCTLLKWLCIFLPSYIHPDEHIQSGEVMGQYFFHYDGILPHEYHPDTAIRSVLPAYLTSGLSYHILSYIYGIQPSLSSSTLLYLPRFTMFLYSLLMDYISYQYCSSLRISFISVYVMMNTSWMTLVLFLRPFSNGIESLLWLLAFTIQFSPSFSNGKKWLFLSLLTTFGCYIRFTFLLFMIPIYIYMMMISFVGLSWKRYGMTYHIKHYFPLKLVGHILVGVIGVGLLLPLYMWIDYHYFHRYFIAPIAGLQYNMNLDHLALHGIHPRYLHLLLHIPLLMGGYGLIWCKDTVVCIWTLLQSPFDIQHWIRTYCYPKHFLLFSIFIPLFLLSMAPHQEPRFLLPLLIPFCFYCGSKFHLNGKVAKAGVVVWVALQLAMIGSYGVLHQGGVVRSVGYVQEYVKEAREAGKEVIIIPKNVMMYPHTLLGLPEDGHIQWKEEPILPHELYILSVLSRESNYCVMIIDGHPGKPIASLSRPIYYIHFDFDHLRFPSYLSIQHTEISV